MSQKPKTERAANFGAVRATRAAFDRRNDKSLPLNFSWILDGKLAGMALPTDKAQLANLRETHSIGLICSAIEEENCIPQDWLATGQEHFLIPWANFGVPSLDHVVKALEVMRAADEAGKAIVVHCFAGKGRTGTLLALFLVKFRDTTGLDAIQRVRELRPGSIETLEQEQFIVRFFNSLCTDPSKRQIEPAGQGKNPFARGWMKQGAATD